MSSPQDIDHERQFKMHLVVEQLGEMDHAHSQIGTTHCVNRRAGARPRWTCRMPWVSTPRGRAA